MLITSIFTASFIYSGGFIMGVMIMTKSELT